MVMISPLSSHWCGYTRNVQGAQTRATIRLLDLDQSFYLLLLLWNHRLNRQDSREMRIQAQCDASYNPASSEGRKEILLVDECFSN
jgi:hypothetical protein